MPSLCLDRLNEWADKWQMQFDVNKCKVLGVGRENPQYRYIVINEALIGSDYEKD